jgi:hypothetical protein
LRRIEEQRGERREIVIVHDGLKDRESKEDWD